MTSDDKFVEKELTVVINFCYFEMIGRVLWNPILRVYEDLYGKEKKSTTILLAVYGMRHFKFNLRIKFL